MKNIKNFLFLLIIYIVFNTPNVYAVEEFSLCSTDALITFRLAGYIILAAKILVPLIIITLACIDLFKLVISGDDKDMKAAGVNLVKRVIAGVIIFFIPTIVYLVLNFVSGATDINSKFENCNECLLNPLDSKCSNAITNLDK